MKFIPPALRTASLLLPALLALIGMGIIVSLLAHVDQAGAAEPSVRAIVFTMEGCPHCQRMKRDLVRQPVAGVSFDSNAERAAAEGVRAFPTTIVSRDGHIVSRLVGYVSPARLERAISSAKR
jgi:thioredoxin-related protein